MKKHLWVIEPGTDITVERAASFQVAKDVIGKMTIMDWCGNEYTQNVPLMEAFAVRTRTWPEGEYQGCIEYQNRIDDKWYRYEFVLRVRFSETQVKAIIGAVDEWVEVEAADVFAGDYGG